MHLGGDSAIEFTGYSRSIQLKSVRWPVIREPVMHEVVTIVLAGGMSRRMGQDKARLICRGLPMLTQICQVAAAVSQQVYIVHGDDRSYADLLPIGCEVILDRCLQGPLAALREAGPQILFAHPQITWFLVLSCDLPNLTQEALQIWIQQLPTLPPLTLAYLPQANAPDSKSAQATSPIWDVLCGFYSDRSLTLLNQFADSGGQSIQRWLQLPTVLPYVQPLQWDDRQIFVNCNTVDDYSAMTGSGFCIYAGNNEIH